MPSPVATSTTATLTVHPPPSLAELPDLLTVEEAAALLRIGRASAYELARVWRASGGQEGLPVIALGRSLRVPRTALEHMVRVEATTEAGTAEHGQGRAGEQGRRSA
ncbi:MAG TPA: helix-turn-helix domain-containing protein [Acidimicrobiales bacterium]|nr:helix-turn-helix domain-containing protein [Acidimicrobiales bacterium]